MARYEKAKGDPIYQTIDHSKLVPLLVAAVKELIGKVEALEAAQYNTFTYTFLMTPQELYEQTKTEIESDTQKSQQLQQEINNINLKIFANQQLLKKFESIDGVDVGETA